MSETYCIIVAQNSLQADNNKHILVFSEGNTGGRMDTWGKLYGIKLTATVEGKTLILNIF